MSGAGGAASTVTPFVVLTFALAGLVFAAVVAGLAIALRPRAAPLALAEDRGLRIVLLFGGAVPAVLVAAFFVASLVATASLTATRTADLSVDVVAHQWWWEFRYGGAVVANELHVPVGERVELRLRSADVIHSFWVPELQGKTDVLPDRTNTMWLSAARAGRFDGVCSEFCGVQHAWMRLIVVAEPRGEFESWLARQGEERRPPSGGAAEGERVFLAHVCVSCHTIRGTPAAATIAPDLTHLATRSLLGAGVLPNRRDTLRDWLADPQHFKPGSLMPNASLTDAELDALVAYLGSLD
ncbi:MAG TPA: cytochrome c oxidase subunit II [Candidatus Limnocylindria bacterium]|nr:cytochrome c oxidase subunit II [Candidatus Limnocylindria bacterium]